MFDRSDVLATRWDKSFPGRQSLGRELIHRYSSVTRAYHGLDHLSDVLRHVDELAVEADQPLLVELAAWYHDAVYDVRRDDNEDASAALAEATLPAYDFDDEETAEVARLVRLTATHAPPRGDRNGAVLCDADLAILASDPGAYAEYTHAIRSEYRHVPDSRFVLGRAEVLRRLLALPSLFSTEHGRDHWEKPARTNLAEELRRLLGDV